MDRDVPRVCLAFSVVSVRAALVIRVDAPLLALHHPILACRVRDSMIEFSFKKMNAIFCAVAN